jgi:hypothetical protein
VIRSSKDMSGPRYFRDLSGPRLRSGAIRVYNAYDICDVGFNVGVLSSCYHPTSTPYQLMHTRVNLDWLLWWCKVKWTLH